MDGRERLVAAASELMYAHGYGAVGVQQLCELAEVKKGSFYHWFPSKAALAVAMLEANWQRTRDHVFVQAFDPGISPLDRFDRYAALLEAHNRDVRAKRGSMQGCRFGNFAAELSTEDPAIRAQVADVFAAMSGYFGAAIRDAVSVGDIPPIEVEPAALAVLAHMEGTLLLAKAANEPALIARFGDDVRALLRAPRRPIGAPTDHGIEP